MTNDKQQEKIRYDHRAEVLRDVLPRSTPGAMGIRTSLREPYTYYEDRIRELIESNFRVLEIGSGTGEFTKAPLETGADICASDISAKSLQLLKLRYASHFPRLQLQEADMESLPFDTGNFDAVLSAGSLSYGDNATVMTEIHRVLKPGGVFICVDSLNHSFIYRFNRWLHYLRGNRSRSTLVRMPTLTSINSYERRFGGVEVRFFGSISWLSPLLEKAVGVERTARFSSKVDEMFKVRRSAFKFVMVARKHHV